MRHRADIFRRILTAAMLVLALIVLSAAPASASGQAHHHHAYYHQDHAAAPAEPDPLCPDDPHKVPSACCSAIQCPMACGGLPIPLWPDVAEPSSGTFQVTPSALFKGIGIAPRLPPPRVSV